MVVVVRVRDGGEEEAHDQEDLGEDLVGEGDEEGVVEGEEEGGGEG